MIRLNRTPSEDGPLPEEIIHIREDVNLFRLFVALERAGLDLVMRTDKKLVIEPGRRERSRGRRKHQPRPS